MGVPKRLTEMQKRFAEYLVFNEGRTTGADAAIAAGYSEKTVLELRHQNYKTQNYHHLLCNT
jgi:phage terminase small subunit